MNLILYCYNKFPEFGRFLAVAPLFEMMPRHTPYHYRFNSLLVYCDPNGLAPKKEKNGEKLQEVQLPEIEEASDFFNFFMKEPSRVFFTFEESHPWLLKFNGGGGSRTGGNSNGKNGIPLTDKVKNEIKSHFVFFFNGDEDGPPWLQEEFFKELFASYGNEISQEDYDFLTSEEHQVNLYSPSAWKDFTSRQGDLSSWWKILWDNIREFFGGKPQEPVYGIAYSGNHILHFQSEMFTNDKFNLNNYELEGTTFLGLGYLEPSPNKKSDIILHELGHSWALYINGNEYYSWNWRYKENWAIFYNNIFRSKNFQGYTNETWFWPFKRKNL